MKRKVIRLGTATLVTSLPRKWVKQFGLEPGDYLDVSERNKSLVFTSEKDIAVAEKQLDCRKLTTRLVEEYLLAAYTLGYRTIELIHEPRIREYRTGKPVRTQEFLQEKASGLIGLEIIEQSDTRTVFKELAEVSQEELLNIFRRCLFLLKDMSSSLLSAARARDKEALNGISARHRNVRKFLLYFHRVLNRQGYIDFAKTNLMFVVADNIGLIAGTLRMIAEDALASRKKFSKEVLEAFDATNNLIARYSEFFFKYEPETAVELSDLREKIWEKSRKPSTPQEGAVLARLAFIGANLMHCIRARFGIEL